MNKAFLRLFEYGIDAADLKKLSVDQRAVFAVLCYSISELNSLQKLFLFSNHDLEEEPEIVAAWVIQSNMLLRTMSSKLFELREFLSFSGKYNKTRDPEIRAFGKESKLKLAALDAHNGFEVAKRVRHEATFHYYLQPARQRVQNVSETAMHSMFLHNLNGNQFLPFGEEAIFSALINEMIDESKGRTAHVVIEEWAEWSSLAIRAANEMFLVFLNKFIEKNAPHRKATERFYWVNPALVGDIGDDKIPVFIRQN